MPCSSNTLGQVAHWDRQQLDIRAAAVTLKERARRLVFAHREMPLSGIDMNKIYKILTDAGARLLAPCNPGLYF